MTPPNLTDGQRIAKILCVGLPPEFEELIILEIDALLRAKAEECVREMEKAKFKMPCNDSYALGLNDGINDDIAIIRRVMGGKV